MTAADREEVAREALRAAVARAVDDSGGDLLGHLGDAYLGQGADAQVIAFALEALGRRLTERAVAAQVDAGARRDRIGSHTCSSGCACHYLRREAARRSP